MLIYFLINFQAERQRKEEADAHRKAEDEAKKKIALSNMGSGYSSILQRVSGPSPPLSVAVTHNCRHSFVEMF